MMVHAGFTLCWIYIQIGWYYKWTFIMPLILYHKKPNFKNYGLLLVPWISFFPFVRWFYACHPHYIFHKLKTWHGDFIIISFESDTWQGNPLGGMLFALAHIYVLRPIAPTHLTCVFPSFIGDTHIIGIVLDVVTIYYDYMRSL